MKRFFDYPDYLLDYFREQDRRFADRPCPKTQPAPIAAVKECLSDVKVILWDIYGTLCGVGLGDMEQASQNEDRLQTPAQATMNEFHLQEPLYDMEPDKPVGLTLRDLYLNLIDESHQKSMRAGIDVPEVLIERIWEEILTRCEDYGWQRPWNEPLLHTAFRVGYFFDWSLQTTCLYENAAETLPSLRQSSKLQGIISNAQFYTPLHLRRLLRRTLDNDHFELDEVFMEPLVFFSYELGFSKPNPGSFQRAIDYLGQQGFMPEDIVYIGNDMLNDIWAAQKCGMKTILFAGDARQTTLRLDDPRCSNVKPDAIANNMQDILSYLT